MPLETEIARSTQRAVSETTRMVETAVKKAWTILDAACEKKLPSETLSPNAVRAIQGSSPSE